MSAIKKNRNLSILPVFFAALISTIANAGDTEFDFVQNTITGAGFKDTADWSGLKYLSLAGGAPILLSGLNFASQASWNSFKFEPGFQEGMELWGPDMSSDDQMNSNDMNGRLGYIVPPVSTLLGFEMDMFNGEFLPSGYGDPELGNRLMFTVSIRNNEQHWSVECSSASRCAWGYNRDYTPQLLDITPPNLAQGQELHFHLNAKGAHSTTVTPDSATPYRSIHIGQYLLDTEDIIEDGDRLKSFAHDTQYAIMTDGYAMNSTEPRIMFYNGLAMLMRGMTHCNFAGDDCWSIRVHPRIKSVTYNEGYTTGGQRIKIEGVSFNGTNIDVTVGGEVCDITDSDLDYIICMTNSAAAPSTIGYQPGQPGMTQIQTDEDYNEYLVLSSTFEVMNLNSSNPLSGWWTAPSTGDFRFYVSCSSACQLRMNHTHSFDPALISTDAIETEVVASLEGGTTWRNYYQNLEDDGHFSAWLTLTEGEQYYMSATGAEEMSVAVEFRNLADSEVIVNEWETCTVDHTPVPCTEGDAACSCTYHTEMQDVTTTTCLLDTPVACTSGDTDCVCTFTTESQDVTTTTCLDLSSATCNPDYDADCTCTETTSAEDVQVETCEITVCADGDAGCTCTSETNNEEVTIATCFEDHIPSPCSNGDADCTCITESETIYLPAYTDHFYAYKSMQRISYEHTNVLEQWSYTVQNPDDQTYTLNLVNVLTDPVSFYTTSAIRADASAGTVQSAINGFYRSVRGCTVEVELEMYDASGAVTNNSTLADSMLYTVTVSKLMETFSTTGVMAIPTGDEDLETSATSATLTVTPPMRGRQSSPPFNGTFVVSCTDFQGVVYVSDEIKFDESTSYMQWIMMNSMGMLVEKLEVYDDGLYDHRENGISFVLHFTGLDYEVPKCTIAPSQGEYPLTGNDDMRTTVEVLKQHGETVFMPVIPFDQVHSDAQTPQIFVHIDGMPALCVDLNCDFTYIASDSMISTQVLADDDSLTLTGTLLPNDNTDKIRLGPVACSITTHSDAEIVCQLDDTRTSGEWRAYIRTEFGLIPNEIANADKILIPVVATGISPNIDVNYLGGDVMTITGDSFGYNTDAISVVYDDGTICDVIDAQMTTISCVNRRFTSGALQNQGVTLTINGVDDTTLAVVLLVQAEVSVSMLPTSASPVLKTELVITLAQSYPNTMVQEDFTAVLFCNDDEEYERELYIMSVDDATKQLTIKFPGAPSGTYLLQLSSVQHGRIDSDLLILEVHGTVTNITPLQGSKYGGALVTITGENFGDVTTDNPVMIGSQYCYVLTTSATQITCRTDLLTQQAAQDELIIVFLKTSEEAATPNGDDILFTYQVPTTEVIDIQVQFDDANFKHQVVVTGTGIDDTIQLLIDGHEQTLVQQDSVSATFDLVNLGGTISTDIQVLTDMGYPEGSEITHSIDVAPALLLIEPAVGSAGGSIITVTGSGFGAETVGLNLLADGVELCETVTITAYGSFLCHTNQIEVANGAQMLIAVNGEANIDSFVASDVAYEQSETITVTSASVSGNTVVFSGSGFDSSLTGKATLNGVDADSVTVSSTTSATASWSTTGVPTATVVPSLSFEHADGYTHYAAIGSSVSFSNVHSVTATSSGLDCSFAGGCHYAIESDGLYGSLLNSANEVRVCGSPCTLIESDSTAQSAVCEIAKLSTTYSVNNYKVRQSEDLIGEVFPEDSAMLHDHLTIEHYESDISSGCEVGVTFKEGHVGVLDEAKIFIGFLVDKTPYVDNLAFHGSNDNWATWEELHLFGEEIHEGWNYIDYREDSDVKPAYNSYRFYGSVQGSCQLTEFKLHGVEAVADENSSYTCTPKILIGGEELAVSLNDVTYSASNTPKLTAITPRYGSVLGGETITLTGENLDGGATTVNFDNRACTITSQSATEIVCETSDKPWVPDTPVTVIEIEGKGLVATQGLVFRYVSRYSDTETWGGDVPPLEGESFHVPTGQHLLFDVDSTPELNAIIVEGSLIFAPDADPLHQRTFDANFIMVNHGYFELGTEEFPYTSKMTITMHATRFSPSFSIYGNKMIGCRFCNLSMHGIPKTTTWTRLASTAEPGDTVITVQGEPDWNVGDHIVIAGTTWWSAYDHEEAYISAISGSTITLTEPLLHQHISVAPTFGGVEMPMRAEVGLLTRNVVFRGNPADSRKDLFGAHIMVHSPGDESSTARIHYIELTEAGQAFKLGRYAIHFHMIGTVHGSLVKGNAIHHSYNRACTTHGVHYFKVEQNVAYDTMGHSFFIEDAVETKCVYDGNLSILTRASNSFLNTDQTPGGFWITNADNILINNAIVGSDAYSFWYDMQTTGIGANFDPNICPERVKLGEFRNNTAHSSRKYGLRIFHALVPHQYPCKASNYDPEYAEKGYDDPYWENPKVPAIFEDFIGWKMGRNAAITERTGAVVFKNFKIADSGIAGVEFSAIENIDADGYAMMDGGMIIGNTKVNDADGLIENSSVWGFIGARHEYLTVKDVSFYNFDFQNSAAIGTCSHCFHPASTDSGGRTLTTTGLNIDSASVPRRILYQEPWREIIHDLDGSLTGKGPDSWATFYYPHIHHDMCDHDEDQFNGVVCDSTTKLRRIAFHSYQPQSMTMNRIKVAQWSTEFEAEVKADETALFDFKQDVDHSRFSVLMQREKPDPKMGWPIVVATGHRYRFHWQEGIDFEQMSFDVSPLWTEDDANVHMMTNFTDVRMSINITDLNSEKIWNQTYTTKTEEELESGDNVIYNQTEVREFLFVINGKKWDTRRTLKMEGFRCIVDCYDEEIDENVEMADSPKGWSDPFTWPDGVPVEGAEVEIPPGEWIEFDIEDSPILTSITINGRLSFKNDIENPTNRTLRAWWIYVRAGELLVGSPEQPYEGHAEIRVYGDPEAVTIAPSMMTEFGNKGLFIVNKVEMYGKSRDQRARLWDTVHNGDLQIRVDPALDWVQWDTVAILPTAMQPHHIDYRIIDSYDAGSGMVTLTEPVEFYHWGQPDSTAGKYNGVDMRGEVVLLTRNVKFAGNDSDSWGGQILVNDNLEWTGVQREGHLVLDNVEVFNCSQRNTFKSGIRFESASLSWSSITNSVVHGSHAWAFSAQYSANINIDSTAFIGARAVGVNVYSSNNVTINNAIAGDVRPRSEMVMQKMVDKEGVFSMCAYFNSEDTACYGNSITNSVAFGGLYAGFVVPGHDCDDAASQTKFRDNVAHSMDGSGAYIFPDVTGNDHSSCYEGSHFAAYKCDQTGVGTHFKSKEIRMSYITSIDNELGINLQIGMPDDKNLAVLKDSWIHGETEAEDCPEDYEECHCQPKSGIMLFSNNHKVKSFHIDAASPLPMHKVKSYGGWAGDTLYRNNKFINFNTNKTLCGAPQAIFAVNEYDSDYIPMQNFEYTEFENVYEDAMANLMDPPEKWNNLDDCIGFPCTAPSNIVMNFKRTSFTGIPQPFLRERDFQIVSDTPGASDTFENCEFKQTWNAWQCTNDNLGLLMFIGDDIDWEDRNVAPVWITNEETGYTNKINHQMDHMWDGFYTGQKHKSQFQAMIQTKGNYTIEYTSTPFKEMRYEMRAASGMMKIKVHYWNAGSYEVYANGELKDAAPWDKEIGSQAELTGYKGCGENRYVGVVNYLEFIMTPYCLIEVKPVDAILSNVRMEWTMDEFYAQGGPTSFVDRVSASLGIHASQMKVVAVYTGSVVVEYEIEPEEGVADSAQALRAIKSQLNVLIESGDAEVFGAPVLSASTNGEAIIDDPDYNPATQPVQTTQIDEEETVTISDEAQVAVIASTTSLIVIFAVIVLLIICCFGVGTFVICTYQINKQSKQIAEVQKKHALAKEMKRQGQAQASESGISIDHQFEMQGEVDMDIFTSKKRNLKVNQEEVQEESSRDSAAPFRGDQSSSRMLKQNTRLAAKLDTLKPKDKKAFK